MIKVSIVIPTYATAPEGLKRLVTSLDNQSMPAEDYEVIFVDDGSPDDTLKRVRRLQTARPNVQVESIKNSGWPSRPRNVGLGLAQGEYVLFMDHDDVLYPDGLRAAYELAHRSNADVLSGKESRTDDPSWALDVYVSDAPQALGHKGPHPLVPTNPHKLYRRELLIENTIRFPEGRMVLWEDVFFNLQVARHAKVMSKLSSVPFYHWVTTEGSGTTMFNKSDPHYWKMLRQVCEAADRELADDQLVGQHEQLVRVQYTSRVLGAFNVGYLKRTAEARRLIFNEARTIREEFGLRRFDSSLSVSVRLRAKLLEDGRQDLLERLCAEDLTIAGWGRAESAEWRNGVLHVSASVEWSSAQGRRHTLSRGGDRVLKVLSPALTAVLSETDRDMTAEIAAAKLAFAVWNREDKVAWTTPSEWSVRAEDDKDGTVRLVGTLTTIVDPMSAAFGAALASNHWDLQTQARLGAAVTQRNLRSDVPTTVTLSNGHLHLLYPNDSGDATLIPDGQLEAVRRLTPVSATLVDAPGRVRIELSGHHDGIGSIGTSIGLDVSTDIDELHFTSHPAVLHVEDGRAALSFEVSSEVMRVRLGDRIGLRPRFWTIFTGSPTVTLQVGQLPKIRTTAEVVAPKESSRSGESTAPPSNGQAPTATTRPTSPSTPRKIKRSIGKLLRRWGLR